MHNYQFYYIYGNIYITLLKAKIFAKIIEISSTIKKIQVLIFLVNSYHFLLAVLG